MDDYKKLGCTMQYLRGTIKIPLVLEAKFLELSNCGSTQPLQCILKCAVTLAVQ